MAKIKFEFDTVEKTGSVTLNGVEIPNVDYFSSSKSYDDPTKWEMRLTTSMVEFDGIRGYTSMYANEIGGLEERPATSEEIAKLSSSSKAPVAQLLAKAIAETMKGSR